jgi:glycosyltransferase involved in cell wall biosynthesis
MRSDACLEIWGPDNGERSSLERLTRELGLEGHVRFMGVARGDELPAIARRHSFYLQLSRREGMAMSVVEAMQLGLVPIVTPVGEMQHYCQAGQTGLVCDPERLGETVSEVVRLLDHPAEYARIRALGRERWAAAPLYSDDVCQAARDL